MSEFNNRDNNSGALLNKNSSALDEYKFKKNILKHINMLIDKQEELGNKILDLQQELVELKNKKV